METDVPPPPINPKTKIKIKGKTQAEYNRRGTSENGAETGPGNGQHGPELTIRSVHSFVSD